MSVRYSLAGGFLAAAALVLGAGQSSQAAATPSPGWHSYDPGTGNGSVLGIYAPGISDAWAVGETASDASVYEHFNGAGWSDVSGPDIGSVFAVDGTSDSDLWVLSADSSAHYNGSSWTTYSLNIPAGLTGVGALYTTGVNQVFAAGPDDAWARVFVASDGGEGIILEHFNGTAWSVVTNAPNITDDGNSFGIGPVTGSGPDDVWVSAAYDNGATSELLHFNGSSWTAETLPGKPFGVDVDVTGPGQALALGLDSSGKPYAAKLSGGTWTQVSMPAPGLEALSATAGGGTVWAEMLNENSDATTLWKWSGNKWAQIKPDNTVGSLAGAGDGSGLWSYTIEDPSLGGNSPSQTELFAG